MRSDNLTPPALHPSPRRTPGGFMPSLLMVIIMRTTGTGMADSQDSGLRRLVERFVQYQPHAHASGHLRERRHPRFRMAVRVQSLP